MRDLLVFGVELLFCVFSVIPLRIIYGIEVNTIMGILACILPWGYMTYSLYKLLACWRDEANNNLDAQSINEIKEKLEKYKMAFDSEQDAIWALLSTKIKVYGWLLKTGIIISAAWSATCIGIIRVWFDSKYWLLGMIPLFFVSAMAGYIIKYGWKQFLYYNLIKEYRAKC